MRKSTVQQSDVNADVVRQLIAKNTESQFMAYFQEKLKDVYCPLHGSIPEIKLIQEPGGYSVDLLNDCCATFTALCAEKIK